jgi:Flp pilus assembly pilin Flp
MEAKQDVNASATSGLPVARGKRRIKVGVIAGVVAVVVVALALGLGLGLGLKHDNTSNALISSTPAVSWRRDPQDYFLSNSFDTSEANTTRTFTLNLTEIPNGAPDGVSRRLLLINGQFPGPVIEANDGDRLIVEVNNFMTVPSAMHWHGQYQNGTSFESLRQEQIIWTARTVSHSVQFSPIPRSHITSPFNSSGHIGIMRIIQPIIKTDCSDL